MRALFNSFDHVTRGEFQTFAKGILLGQTAIVSVSWVPRIRPADRTAHELAGIHDGLSGYRIHSAAPDGNLVPSPEMDDQFPVFYSSGLPLTSSVYGLNVNDGGLRQKTIERARDGDLIATSTIFVLRTGSGSRLGFIASLPVYGPGLTHDTIVDRRNNLVGFVQGTFQIRDLIETILSSTTTPGGLDLYLLHADSDPNSSPLYFHPSRQRTVPVEAQTQAALAAGLRWSGDLKVGDDQWTLIAKPIPGGVGTANYGAAWLALACGLLFTMMAVAYVWSSGRYTQRVKVANGQLDLTLNNMSQALLMFDASGRLVITNRRFYEMYGLSPEIMKPGCTIRELVKCKQLNGTFSGDPEMFIQNIQSNIAQGNAFERLIDLPDGRTIAAVTHPVPGGGWVATHEDITARRQAETKISHMALHDALTNLPNRFFFREQIENRLAYLGRDEKFAVLCLDLDQFKSVNDTLGHPYGDKLLRQVGERLRGCLREGDSIARLGGDEFAILQGGMTQASDTTSLIARLFEAISKPFDLDEHQVAIGVSIGVALAPIDATDPDQLHKNADMALYRAKADGRGTYRFFEPEMDARMQARRTLEIDLRKAIVNGEFEVYYQPLVNLETEQISGFEALVRWNHPQRGIVLPMDFIPLAEETALIVPIGEWVLRQACEEAAKWPSNISVAVNLSAVQFKTPDLSQTVINALAHSGLAADRLQLEITESVLLLNSEPTLNTLHMLRALGVHISMDDFGTGYSSLSYLRSYPFDKIKIDRSFIKELSSNEESVAIIRAVAGLGYSLRMATMGEGIETRYELDVLKREGCTEGQGYLFGKPQPAKEVYVLLAKQALKIKAVA